jgi:hypothetical protein
MCEMRNPSKDFTRAIIWLNAIAIPLYVIIGCVVYNFAGQYVVAPALGSAPGVPSQVAYGILIPTMLGSGLVFGHTGIKFMYNFVMDTMIKSKAKLTDNTLLTWGVWLGCGTFFWVVAFIFANAIPAFNSILGISSALFVTWYGKKFLQRLPGMGRPNSKLTPSSRFTFGLANVQWIFLNWGQQFSTWQKSLLAIFNWFLFFGMSSPKRNLSCPRATLTDSRVHSFRVPDSFRPLHVRLRP